MGFETLGGVLQGGVIGALMGSLSKDLAATAANTPGMQANAQSFNVSAPSNTLEVTGFAQQASSFCNAVLSRQLQLQKSTH